MGCAAVAIDAASFDPSVWTVAALANVARRAADDGPSARILAPLVVDGNAGRGRHIVTRKSATLGLAAEGPELIP